MFRFLLRFFHALTQKKKKLIKTTPNGCTVIDAELLMQEPDVIEVLEYVAAKKRAKN